MAKSSAPDVREPRAAVPRTLTLAPTRPWPDSVACRNTGSVREDRLLERIRRTYEAIFADADALIEDAIEEARKLTQSSRGELPASDRQAVQEHLAACPRCRAALAGVDGLAAALVDVPTPPVPAGFASRVTAIARRRQLAPRPVAYRWRLAFVPLGAAAAVAAFALGVWGATEFAGAPSARATAGDFPPAMEMTLAEWLEATPADSLASRYFAAVGAAAATED